jgi:putative FmdB family regulatory protein
MPTYAYECSNCGEQFERVQKFTDPPVTKCPNCKKNKVRRVIQASPVVFKGSGWYITDHRTNKTKTSTGSSHSESGNGDKPAEKSDGGSDKAEKATASEKSEKADKPAKSESKSSKSESSSASSSKSSSD